MQVLVNLDLGGNQLLNFLVQGYSGSDPGSGKPGQMIYNTGTNVLKVCTNATGPVWTALGSGSGTVTQVSVATANGFAGSVSSSTTVPAITVALNGNPTGLLRGDGAGGIATATSSQVPAGLLKGSGTGTISAAVSATDYAPATTGTSILKASSGGFANAASGTDYAPATSGSSLLKANGSGGFSNAVAADIPTIAESQVTSLTTDLAAKAPIASPTFTGTPAAPTAGSSTNTTQLATTAFVQTAVTGIAESQVTNLTTDLAAKAPLASPTFTGSPAAPTPTAGDSTTLLATTAFVTAAVSAAVQGLQVKNSVVAATTGSETFTVTSGSVVTIAGTSVDGVSPAVNDLILVKDAPVSTGAGEVGSTRPANGMYVVTANTTNLSVSRAADMTGTANLPSGAFTFVEGGTTQKTSGWVVASPTTNISFTYGTTAIKWVQFSGAGQILAGTGISVSGNTISVVNPLNQNTTGTASNVTGTVAVANGGTGQTTIQAAINALLGGTMTAGLFARANGTNFVASALATADVPTNASVAPASPGTNTKFGLVYNSGLIATSSTVLTITHSLNNAAPGVTVWNSSGQVVQCDVAKVDANNITLTFANAPLTNTIQATVIG